jgi:hypothetical protein
MALPAYRWRWARWMLGHDEYKPYGPKNFAVRPGSPVPPSGQIPKDVREWYYKTFKYEIAMIQNPPASLPSPFQGKGGFTSHDPLVAVKKFKGLLKTIAVHADAVDENGKPRVTREIINQLLVAGFDVVPWYSWDHPPQMDDFNHGIGQAEGPTQMLQTIDKLPLYCQGQKAIVTNNYYTYLPEKLSGYFALAEAYMNVNPNAVPGSVVQDSINRGFPRNMVSPVFGCYVSDTEGAVDTPLEKYVSMWTKASFWIYMLETLPDRDIEYLRTIQ